MKEQLIFVNGQNAPCGCSARFSDGGGQYSDVIFVTLCPQHQAQPETDPEKPDDGLPDETEDDE